MATRTLCDYVFHWKGEENFFFKVWDFWNSFSFHSNFLDSAQDLPLAFPYKVKLQTSIQKKPTMDTEDLQAQWKKEFRLSMQEDIYKMKQLPGLHTIYQGMIQVS